METPDTRAEFERRMHMLKEQIDEGRLHLPRGMNLGLEDVRRLPNGRIDLLSINEMARLQANTAANMPALRLDAEMMEKLKTEEATDKSMKRTADESGATTE